MRGVLVLLLLALCVVSHAAVVSQDLTSRDFLIDGSAWQNFTVSPIVFDHRVVKPGDVFDIKIGGGTNSDSLARRRFQLILGGQVLADTQDMWDVIGAQQGMRYQFEFTIECTAVTTNTISYRTLSATFRYGDVFNQQAKMFLFSILPITVGMNDGYFLLYVNMEVDPGNPVTFTNDRFVVIAGANTRFDTSVTSMAFTSPQCVANTPTVGVVLTKNGNVVTLHVPAATCQSATLVLTLSPIVLTSNIAIPALYRPSAALKDGVIYSNAGVELTGGIVGVSSAGIITVSFSATLALNAAFGTSSAFSISWIVV